MKLKGKPIEVRYSENLKDTAGNDAHAATFVRRRLIVLDAELLRNPREHRRILTHEVFHFVWVRLGNRRRMAWEELLRGEWRKGVRGEAGWSAEWRKGELSEFHVSHRTRKWREYCCESYCDTAASLHEPGHDEVTLAGRYLDNRRRWFAREHDVAPFPI